MDTLAFWLPLILLFLSALLGAVIKRRSCDHCLKKFNEQKVLFPFQNGEWICGKLEVFAQGIELQNVGDSVLHDLSIKSRILHSFEVDKIPFFIRQAPDPDTRLGVLWKKERERLLHPPLRDRVKRSVLNAFNMLRDSFGQAFRAIIGTMSKDTRLGKAKDSEKRFQEMQSNLTEMVPNAWEPILEKYLGQRIAIEREIGETTFSESGILEDYSSKYLLLRDVCISEPALKEHLFDLGCTHQCSFDALYTRPKAVLRYALKDRS
jgi:hypothetical protein